MSFFFFGDSANPKVSAGPNGPPRSEKPIAVGVYVSSWQETPANLDAMSLLHPAIVRLNAPAWAITHELDGNQPERDRLAADLDAAITRVRALPARALLVTSLALSQGATQVTVLDDAPELATHYGALAAKHPGCAWELGNEAEIPGPVLGATSEALPPDTYAAYFAMLAEAIRAADPTATIVTAGTSGVPVAWITEVLARVAPDAIGIHPYGIAPLAYAETIARISSRVPVWFTEFGKMAASAGEIAQRDALVAYLDRARGVADVAIWFSLSDRSAEKMQSFGLIDAEGRKRLSFLALESYK